MSQVVAEWQNYPTSIFSVMTREANAANALNLAQGFPNFDGPAVVKDAVCAAIQSGKNQYAPAAGIPELRHALADYRERRFGARYDPEHEITVYSGATEAIFCAVQIICRPGDEIIALAPCYDSYAAAALACGATLRGVPLDAKGGWGLDVDELARTVTARTRCLIINTPHNPTGHVLTPDELKAIAEIARRYDLAVIADEVYEEIVFAPHQHVSIATLPGMRERTIAVSSSGKSFSVTGWKVGATFAPPTLTTGLRNFHQFVVFCTAAPIQYGLVQAYRLDDTYFHDFKAHYRERRDVMLDILRRVGFTCETPQGSYFILANYEKFSQRPDLDFALFLTREIGVAVVPVSPFYPEPAPGKKDTSSRTFVRFAFCKDIETLRSAGSRLERLRDVPSL